MDKRSKERKMATLQRKEDRGKKREMLEGWGDD